MTNRTIVMLTQDEVTLLLAMLVTARPVNDAMNKLIHDLLSKLGPFSANIEKFPHRPNQ
jgi:hypothetical protein